MPRSSAVLPGPTVAVEIGPFWLELMVVVAEAEAATAAAAMAAAAAMVAVAKVTAEVTAR